MITISNKKKVEKPTSFVTNLKCDTNAIVLFMENFQSFLDVFLIIVGSFKLSDTPK